MSAVVRALAWASIAVACAVGAGCIDISPTPPRDAGGEDGGEDGSEDGGEDAATREDASSADAPEASTDDGDGAPAR